MDLFRAAETPEPTHDASRDLGAAGTVDFDYDLTTEASGPPPIKTSYGDTRLGAAVEEENGLVHAGARNVIARSGNEHWDGDDFELAGEPQRERKDRPEDADPGMPIAKVVVVAAAILGIWMLLKERRSR